MRPAKSQISLGIRPVWSESSLSAWRKLGSLATHWAHSEDSDQTGQMPRLIRIFAGRTVTLLVLSCRGSIMMVANNGKYSLFMSVSSIKNSGRPAMRLKSKKQNMFLASKVISSHHHSKISKFQSRKFSRHIIHFRKLFYVCSTFSTRTAPKDPTPFLKYAYCLFHFSDLGCSKGPLLKICVSLLF